MNRTQLSCKKKKKKLRQHLTNVTPDEAHLSILHKHFVLIRLPQNVMVPDIYSLLLWHLSCFVFLKIPSILTCP